MHPRGQSRRFILTIFVLLFSLSFGACTDELQAPSEPAVDRLDGPTADVLSVEGELLGNVYDGSGLSSATNLYFELIPADNQTSNYLNGTNFDQSLWVNPSAPLYRSIEYFNPEADGPCGTSYADFLSGNSGAEVHDSGPSSGPSGSEGHCIIPGYYRVRLRQGPTVIKDFFIDYIPGGSSGNPAPIATAGDGTQMWIEAPAFNPTATLDYPDLVVNFHLNPPSGYTDTSVLDIENAKSNLNKSSFSIQGSLSGTVTDWFRYRTDRSSTNWSLASRGRMLMGVWWDNNDVFDRSGFFDNAERPVLRVHKYEDDGVTAPATVVAGLEVKRPDEDPQSAPTVTRNISIEVDPTPTACFTQDATSTWRYTDQFLKANCSQGTDLEYRWDTGSGYGAWTDDPVLEFLGHSSSGSKSVKLQVRDLAYSPVPTDTEQKPFSVASSYLSMSGPTYVTNKQLKTYTASVNSDWYERYLSEGSTNWYLTLASDTEYNRIWPAGEYTRRLRAEKVTASPLGRRFKDVEVCHESLPQCQIVFASISPFSTAPTANLVLDDPDLFGIGPWIESRGTVTRYYDLTGLHEPDSPFASIGWLAEPSGSKRSADGAFTVDWTRRDGDTKDVQVIEFAVRPGSGASYRFGMAVDPDLGASPADDRSGYDANRGMVYAYDGSGAIGFILLGDGGRRIDAVDQYGAHRFAPRVPAEAALAATEDGARLLPQEDDVQFIVSAAETSGNTNWRLAILRAVSIFELRMKADEYLRR